MDFSSTELQNKHQRITHATVCYHANSTAPRIAQFFPYTTSENRSHWSFCLLTDHYVFLHKFLPYHDLNLPLGLLFSPLDSELVNALPVCVCVQLYAIGFACARVSVFCGGVGVGGVVMRKMLNEVL